MKYYVWIISIQGANQTLPIDKNICSWRYKYAWTCEALGWVAGEAANMAIGHAVGFIGSGGRAPIYQDGAFIYEGNPSGEITFGNVVFGEKGFSKYRTSLDPWESAVYKHEMGHVRQYGILGPGFLPAYVSQFPVALTVFQNPFQFNILENYFLGGAPSTYQLQGIR